MYKYGKASFPSSFTQPCPCSDLSTPIPSLPSLITAPLSLSLSLIYSWVLCYFLISEIRADMGLRIGQNPTTWQPFQFASPFLFCYAPNSAEKIYPSMLKTCGGSNTFLAYRLAYQPSRSRSRYCRENGIRQACGANFDELSDEETMKQMLNLRDYDEEIDKKNACTVSETSGKTRHIEGEDIVKLWHVAALKLNALEPSLLGIKPEPPQWPERDEVLRISIQRRVNRMEIPISLRIIKRKQQWDESLKEPGDSTYCSIKRAFSSMVFIIRELQSCALQMRESLYSEDLRGIVEKVQRELNVSFVWVFQQVLSRTPTLMVYVMILLANFTACSMAHYFVTAAAAPAVSHGTITENENKDRPQFKLDPMVIRPISISSSSIGAAAAGRSDRLNPAVDDTEGGEEVNLWNSVVEEASRMQAEMSGEALDHKTKQHLVSPVTVELEREDYEDYFRRDLFYQLELSREPNNTLLLSNHAQFLHLIVHDNDRAEECLKRALLVDPMDAEGLCRYADFLRMSRKDLWGAEEKYEQAMAAEPGNPYYASKYSNFLWSTGG
ncbi:hypothetical protein I3760_02G190900 [Carya illinoinensis]|nr:hypothetical protein I3760_02G190900 [Carya illinoinensis]KAG2723869.1 hypothetical protein I3760_02G190900 [Carya illinoinensis]